MTNDPLQQIASMLKEQWLMQDINLLLKKDRLWWEEVNRLERKLEGMELRIGALKPRAARDKGNMVIQRKPRHLD